jgi:hypothetical protein
MEIGGFAIFDAAAIIARIITLCGQTEGEEKAGSFRSYTPPGLAPSSSPRRQRNSAPASLCSMDKEFVRYDKYRVKLTNLHQQKNKNLQSFTTSTYLLLRVMLL